MLLDVTAPCTCLPCRLARPQFGDKCVMEYLSHQRALLPALANTYVLQTAQRTLKVGLCLELVPSSIVNS